MIRAICILLAVGLVACVMPATADVSEKKKPGEAAVDFVGEDLDGKPVRLKDYKGKVVLIDFWASWCAPCIKEFPNMVEVLERHGEEGFAIVGINMDPTPAKAEKFLDKHEEIKWRNVIDVLAEDTPVSDLYGVVPLPASFLVDRNGVIRYVGVKGERLAKAVEELVKEEAPEKGV